MFLFPLFVHQIRAEETTGADSPEIIGLSVGLEGVYKTGFHTPVTVSVNRSGGFVELESFDSDGTPVKMTAPLTEKVQTLYFSLGRTQGSLKVRLLDEKRTVVTERTFEPSEPRGGRVLQSKVKDDSQEKTSVTVAPFLFPRPKPSSRPLFLMLGNEQIGLIEALGELRTKEDQRPILERIYRFSDLPANAIGYEAVETILISTTDPEFFRGVKATDPRIVALADWIRMGGKLILLAGKDSRSLITGDGPLVPLVPGKADPSRYREIRIANAITHFVPKAKNLVMTGSLDAPFLQVPVITELGPQSTVRIAEMETPILIDTTYGFGTISFFGADLSEPPISNWNGRSGLILNILGYDTERTHGTSSDTLLTQLGYSDLCGQIRSILDRFEGVGNIPFSVILLLSFFYILLIGPGDWFLTHRILKKPNLTWITFPIWIILFCLVSVVMIQRTKPTEPRVNRVDMIDVDTVSGLIRGTSWAGIYSPVDARYDFRFEPKTLFAKTTDPNSAKPETKVWFSWQGLQGSGLGGMAPKTISTQLWKDPYEIAIPAAEILGLPIQIHATKSLVARWLESGSPILPEKRGKLSDFDGVPRGTVHNPLAVPLENTMLLYGRWALDLGTLAPGETVVDMKTSRMERHLVIGTSVHPFRDSNRNLTRSGISRYDSEATDLPYVLRTMMFYRLIGGHDTVGLDNSLGHYVDLSDSLRIGRAILVGTVRNQSPDSQSKPSPALDGESTLFVHSDRNDMTCIGPETCRKTVVVRMILPVEK